MELSAAITAVCALILALLKAWQEKKPQRTEEKKADESQEIRKEIAEIDLDAVAARVDDVRRRLRQRDSLSKGDKQTLPDK